MKAIPSSEFPRRPTSDKFAPPNNQTRVETRYRIATPEHNLLLVLDTLTDESSCATSHAEAHPNRSPCRKSVFPAIRRGSIRPEQLPQVCARQVKSLNRYGERKTVSSGDSDELGTLATPIRTDREAPSLALAKVASTNALHPSPDCLAQKAPRAKKYRASNSLPSRIQC
jgi:hypothetical protein